MTIASIPTPIASLLIVDDSPVQRTHAAALCRTLGVTLIYEASNGREALELLSLLVLRPSLMIVDLAMPDMDGVELLQHLHERDLDIPFIVASGRENALIQAVETMSDVMGLRVLAGLQKPLRLDQLARAFGHYNEPHNAAQVEESGVRAPLDKAALSRAIDNGELVVHYQPKVDIRTGIVRGVEALARWQHPEMGLLLPAHFIPLAEKEGLIHAATLSIMARALGQAEVWNARGLKLSVAINFSPCLLDCPSLVEDSAALLACHSLHAEQIVFEITEGSVVAHLGAALGVLARLRIKGFGLSIDDYGTGFSSMQQLARIPFTELKIDHSFVHGAHERKNLRIILQSALDMAHRLGLVTVAEGIETLEDWRLLQELGCTIGQGYLIAEPMPGSALPQWLKRHHGRLQALRAALRPSCVH